MTRMKSLSFYQKALLLSLFGMAIVFGILYIAVTSRVGFFYRNAVLPPVVEDGNTVYAGRIHGQYGKFVVTPLNSVTFQWGDHFYGPYIAWEDPSAIPRTSDWKDQMTGIEILDGSETFFRGGVMRLGLEDVTWLITREDGTNVGMVFSYTTGDGIYYDMDGNPIDRMEPSVQDILELMYGPELKSRGTWMAWFLGVLCSTALAISIFYADELFRWNLSFQIRDAEFAEPSDFQIMGRYIGWGGLTILILILYFRGLH